MGFKIRKSRDRKFFDHGWLKTYHTFSFANYYDPQFMGYRALRVINEDRVDPGRGFPLHEHQDMEILSIVLEGELAHQDSTGTESVLHVNEVQAMSAGTGITHSEYNPSKVTPVHFLQIWIIPDKRGYEPAYTKTTLPKISDQWQVIASKTGRDHSLKIHQDVELLAIALKPGQQQQKTVAANRYGWIQVIDGDFNLNGEQVTTGDGVAIEPNTPLQFETTQNTRLLFFDLN